MTEPVGTIESGVLKVEKQDLLQVDTVPFYLDGYLGKRAAREFLQALTDTHNEDTEAVWEVVINSHGGDMFAGSAIYSELRSYSVGGGGTHWVITRVRGICGSVATLVLQAGDLRLGGVMDTLMIHEPVLSFEDAPMSLVKDSLVQAEDWVERYIRVHEPRLKNMTRVTFRENMRSREWSLSTADAVHFGILDLIDEFGA